MRPRSERAHNEVLNAASRLFAERGIDATSMDAIAAASGVSKATIYKHWPDKDALCLEVLSRIHGHDEASPYRLTGDLRSDLLAVLTHEPPAQFAEVRSRITPHLVSYGLRNPAFGKAWRLRVLEPPRTQLTALLEEARAEGSLSKSVDVDVAIAMLLGPLFYRHIMSMVDRPIPSHLPEAIVESFLKSQGTDVRHAPAPRQTAIPRGSRRRRGLPARAER
jgi:AcrR family transcriptional regulator